MADPIAAVGATKATEYAVAVLRQAHGQQEQEGKQAVQLIQSAAAPLASSGDVGTKLHVVA